MEDSSSRIPDLKSSKETMKERQPSKRRWYFILFYSPLSTLIWVVLNFNFDFVGGFHVLQESDGEDCGDCED